MIRISCLSLLALTVSAPALAEGNGYVPPPAGHTVEMISTVGGASDKTRARDTVIYSGDDFVIRKYESFASPLSLEPEDVNYYVEFTPLYYASCEEDMPDADIRAEAMAAWPLSLGAQGQIGEGTNQVKYRVTGEATRLIPTDPYDVWMIELSYRDELGGVQIEEFNVLKDPNTYVELRYGFGDMERAVAIRTPSKPYQMSQEDKNGLRNCAALLEDNAAKTGQ